MKRLFKQYKLSRRACIVALIAGVVVLLAASIWLFALRGTDTSPVAQMRAVRSDVAKLVLLPANEDPTLATVQDVSQLTDKSLKRVAKNGDQVLLYATARKAYIYRPSENKLVDIQPLVIDASAAQVQGSRILVWDGSAKAGAVEMVTKTLRAQYPSAQIVGTASARRQDYPKTVVIDLTEGDKYDLVTNIAQALGAERGVFPQGEQRPTNADVLVVTGLDKSTGE